MKKILTMLFIVPVSLLSMFALFYLYNQKEPLFFLKNIKINGAKQLNDGEVISKISPFLKESIFHIDTMKLQEILSSHPFVKDVSVKRVYPFSLVIDVKEKIPSALWVNKAGSIFVVDESGDPYRKISPGVAKDLFIINTPDADTLRGVFREVRIWIREGIIARENISEVAYSEGSFTLFSEQEGIEIILGKEDQKNRLKKALAVMNDAKKRGLILKCIDARFEKGAIIQERKG